MFLGTHTPKLDDKGRLILPAKFRDELADGLVIAKFQERCLAIWPISSFVDMTKTVRSASSSQQGVRDYQRILASGASDETPDRQGRIMLPSALVESARLGREVVVAGVYDHLEIWDRAAWRKQLEEVEGSAEHVAERLASNRD